MTQRSPLAPGTGLHFQRSKLDYCKPSRNINERKGKTKTNADENLLRNFLL